MKLSGASSPEKSTVSTIPPIKTAVIFDNLGPYHLARLQAAASQMELLAVQVAGKSVGYAWEANGGLKSAAGPEWKTVTLLEGGTSREIQERELENRMNKALNDFHPQVVFIPGGQAKRLAQH
jgi:hypothetical protein